MDSFKIRVSHTTHSCLASNINLTKNLYIAPPNFKFILDYTDTYGDINEQGLRLLVEPCVTSIITGARLVKIVDGTIFEVTKSRFLDDCAPKQEVPKEKHTQILTNHGIINITIPPPPNTPPPRLPQNIRLIQHAKKKADRRSKIACREGEDCWRHKKDICSYYHPDQSSCNTFETIV